MTIHITRPEIEALIQQRLQSGAFRDAEDVILDALRSSASEHEPSLPSRSLEEVFAAVRGLADDVDFSRNPSTGRPVEL